MTFAIRFLVSCMLGISLWFFLRMHYDHSLSVVVPVCRSALSTSHAVVQEAVRLTLTGPWKTLCNVIHQKPVIKLNTQIYPRGLHEVNITAQQINIPPSLQLAPHATVLLFVNPST